MMKSILACTSLLLSASLALAADPASSPFFEQITIASHADGSQNCFPCMARLSDGRLLVTWSRVMNNDYDVVGAFSADHGKTWTKPIALIANEKALDADPSIVVSGKKVFVTSTTIPPGATGIRTSTTYCVRSEDDGATWSKPYTIPMNRQYTCGKTHHGLRLESGTLLMGYSWDAICETGKTLQSEGEMDLRAAVMRSTDDGQTWTNGGDTNADYTKVSGGAVHGTDEPAIVELDDGSIYMLMRTGADRLYEARSTDEGKTWKDIRPSPLRGSNAPAALSVFQQIDRRGIFVVWDNALNRFPLCSAASFDGGRTWSRPKDIGFPYTGGQASYPSCEQAADGTLVAVWQHDVPGRRDLRCARFNLAWLLEDKLTALQKELPDIRLPKNATPLGAYTADKDPQKSTPAWIIHRDGGTLVEGSALRLAPIGGYYIENQPTVWDGAHDKLVEVRMRVVSREATAPENHSAAEVWIGGVQPDTSCLLLFREDAVAFDESYDPAFRIDTRQFHTYRVLTDLRRRVAWLFIDDGPAPVLATLLTAPYGYNINRILFGDSGGAKVVSGVSEWSSVKWSDVQAGKKPLVVVAFGDSTTAPRGPLHVFAGVLADDLPARGIPARVINAGIGGHNTNQARQRFDRDVLAHSPDFVTIFFGLNDSCIDLAEGKTAPRVAIQRYEENLRYFVRTLRDKGALPILMTPNPVGWTPELKRLYGKPPFDPDDPDGYNILVKQYAAVVRAVARTENVQLVDVYKIFDDYAHAPNQSIHDLMLDGMHPNDRGQRIIADLLLKIIAELRAKSAR